MRLVVSAPAREDLKIISRYTEMEWGSAQKKRYLRQIRARFSALRRYPGLGRARPEIAVAYRSIPAGQHVIFYRATGRDVIILRVLHHAMDIRQQF